MRMIFTVLCAFLINYGSAFSAEIITAKEAHDRSSNGDIILIDIRRAQEWQQSGVAATATLLSMHEQSFLTGLEKLTGGRKNLPIALICATGIRSTWLAEQLEARGYSNLINVREGMFGSQSGEGWIKQNLPMRQPG